MSETSLLREYKLLEQQINKLSESLEVLEQDQSLQRELAFSAQLRALMQEFDKSVADVVSIIDPEGNEISTQTQENATKTPRKKRKLKVYKNPHSGEVIETRGGNHNLLKQWKAEYGASTVEGWLETP